MPDEEDQGLSPPAQFVTVREEMDEEGGMAPSKGAPEVMDEGEGLPPSNLELDEATGTILRNAAKGAPTTINDYTGPTPPPSFQGGPAGRVERVPRGSFLRRLAAIPVLRPPRSMLPSGNAGDRGAAAEPAPPGTVGEPDPPIHIPEATLVEDQVRPAVEATLIEDDAPLAQNDGPFYEATPVHEWKLQHKVFPECLSWLWLLCL